MTARRQWGMLCPDDGGILLEHATWGDRLWCPNNGHGGNGAFFSRADVTEGAASEREAPKPATVDAKTILGVKPGERIVERQPTPVRAKAERPAPEPKACKCGCGGQTKGGVFLPGHDARYHAALKREAAARIAQIGVSGE